MDERNSKTIYILSSIIAVLMLIASVGGLFINNLYRDIKFIKTGWIGNDFVTLFVAIPILLISLYFTIRRVKRAYLILIGTLYYSFYNYSFYLFGAAFNWFFPIYLAIFILSIYIVVYGLLKIDKSIFKQTLKTTKVIRVVSVYLIFWGGLLAIAWLAQWVSFVITNNLPQIIVSTGGTSNLTAAIDLSFLAAGLVLAAVWLWKYSIWGYILSTILCITGTLYTIVLSIGSITQAYYGIVGAMDLLPLWVFLGVGCLVSAIILLKKYPSER